LAQRESGVQTLPETYYGEVLFLDEQKQKREDPLESSLSALLSKRQTSS
jgi:hypothetical protein